MPILPKVKAAWVLPAVMLVTVIGSMVATFDAASASISTHSDNYVPTNCMPGTSKPIPGLSNATPTAVKNAGTPYATFQCFDSQGRLLRYGNGSISYESPNYLNPSPDLERLGNVLFQANCASCHGTNADGIPAGGYSGTYPNLRGLGPATIDFWVSTGRMPAADPRAVQAMRKPPRLNEAQTIAVAAWVNSLAPATPYIPNVNVPAGNQSAGQSLFALNCAACHTITGAGDALAYSTYAPTLHWANARQIAEAIRTGPGNMPRFSGNLTDRQVQNIVTYVVRTIQHPSNPGGLGMGGLGPVAEGFVGLAFGVGILAIVCYWIGDRS